MNERDADRLQSCRRAVQCILRHPELETVAARSSAWTKLRDDIARVAELELRQAYLASHGKELTTTEECLREAARSQIHQVALIADFEGMDSRSRRIFPDPDKNASTADVILAARTCAELATGRSATFVTMGLSRTFVADLLQAADALDAVVAARIDAAGSRTGATNAIPELTSYAMKQLGVLDSILRIHMDAETHAEWKQALRLGRKHRPATVRAPEPEALPQPTLALPESAPLKALPAANILDALIGRLIRRADAVEAQPVQPDVTVEEIRRLPRFHGE